VIARRLSGVIPAAAALAAMLLAGCGGGNPAAGPFENHDSPNGFCGPLESLDRGVFTAGGQWIFRAAGPGIIDKVSLSHPRGLRVLAAWVVEDTGTDFYGSFDGFPPSPRLLLPGVQWAHRQRVEGARITPTRGDMRWNMVLVIKLVSGIGTTDGLDVYYHTSGGSYHLHMIDALELTDTAHSNACNPP
jgi:hypothetical protein